MLQLVRNFPSGSFFLTASVTCRHSAGVRFETQNLSIYDGNVGGMGLFFTVVAWIAPC